MLANEINDLIDEVTTTLDHSILLKNDPIVLSKIENYLMTAKSMNSLGLSQIIYNIMLVYQSDNSDREETIALYKNMLNNTQWTNTKYKTSMHQKDKNVVLLYSPDKLYLSSYQVNLDKLGWNYILVCDFDEISKVMQETKVAGIMFHVTDELDSKSISRFLQTCHSLKTSVLFVGTNNEQEKAIISKGLAHFVRDPHQQRVIAYYIRHFLNEKANVEKLSDVDPNLHVSNEATLEKIYAVEQARINRFGAHFSLFLVSIAHLDKIKEEKGEMFTRELMNFYETFFSNAIRDTDMLFRLEQEGVLVVFLPDSGRIETMYFERRIRKLLDGEPMYAEGDMLTVSALIEREDLMLEEVKDKLLEELQLLQDLSSSHVSSSVTFPKKQTVREVKVSILENDPSLSSLLSFLFDTIQMPNLKLDVRFFENGEDFIDSDWHHSSHQHIVLIERILPQKSGLEIVRYLREQPNQDKFVILLLTGNAAEQNLIEAYELGVDDCIFKPMNIKLLEAKMRRFVQRMI